MHKVKFFLFYNYRDLSVSFKKTFTISFIPQEGMILTLNKNQEFGCICLKNYATDKRECGYVIKFLLEENEIHVSVFTEWIIPPSKNNLLHLISIYNNWTVCEKNDLNELLALTDE